MLREKNQVKDIAKKMKSKRGQALVEFVLILPIVMMILCVIIDFSMIFYKKNHLEGVLNDTVLYIQHGKDISKLSEFVDDDKIKVTTSFDKQMLKVTLRQDVTLITPFSKTFFSNPYTITTDRMILYES